MIDNIRDWNHKVIVDLRSEKKLNVELLGVGLGQFVWCDWLLRINTRAVWDLTVARLSYKSSGSLWWTWYIERERDK